MSLPDKHVSLLMLIYVAETKEKMNVVEPVCSNLLIKAPVVAVATVGSER